MMILFFTSIPIIAAAFFCFNFLSNSLVEYLAITKPIRRAEVMIVEGWLFEFKSLVAFVNNEFRMGEYKYILISGKSYATAATFDGDTVDSPSSGVAFLLREMGTDPSKIKIVEVFSVNEHKTFAMAKAARKWLLSNDPSVRSVNVCSAGAHGRKTWCAYRRVFGRDVDVGILSFSTSPPHLNKWLERRCGTQWLMYIFAGYIYAKFYPVSCIRD